VSDRHWTPNPEGKGLKPMPTKWIHTPTKQIRVPEVLVDEIIDAALKLDQGQQPASVSDEDLQVAIELLEEALTMKANVGGKIKKAIRAALAILKDND